MLSTGSTTINSESPGACLGGSMRRGRGAPSGGQGGGSLGGLRACDGTGCRDRGGQTDASAVAAPGVEIRKDPHPHRERTEQGDEQPSHHCRLPSRAASSAPSFITLSSY